MEQNQSHNELNNDQKLAEQLFSIESLSQFNENALETPHFYFENFNARVFHKMEETNKSKFLSFAFPKWTSYAVAATLLFAIAATFIFTNNSLQNQTSTAEINIQEISNDEIETYVNENESLTEVDWQSELTKYSEHNESFNLNHDSIETNIE